jgi:hypothetical protein
VDFFEPERPTGPPVDVKDAFVGLRYMMGLGRLRGIFESMDPTLDGNEDLSEIVQNVLLDGNEASDLRRWK